jgi:hypothetical protein
VVIRRVKKRNRSDVKTNTVIGLVIVIEIRIVIVTVIATRSALNGSVPSPESLIAITVLVAVVGGREKRIVTENANAQKNGSLEKQHQARNPHSHQLQLSQRQNSRFKGVQKIEQSHFQLGQPRCSHQQDHVHS